MCEHVNAAVDGSISIRKAASGPVCAGRHKLTRTFQRSFGAPLSVALALALAESSARADSMALWRIVHDACVPHAKAGAGPKPCESVDLRSGEEEGVAILKDLVGIAQMLAIPTRRITGIEDPQMLAPDAPPVFAVGWKAKAFVDARLGKQLPRDAIALAINSEWARSQDQLHVHVVRIFVDDAADDGPHTKGLGRYLDGKDRGMVLNFTFRNWVPYGGDHGDFSIKSIAVHEFGHAIGFAHEQNRPDTPGECSKRMPAQGDSTGAVALTPYDKDSVMNYCSANANNNGELSPLDITALQKMYGTNH
jgi:hypothetical protein